ncbi:MAG TPA: hypothetical protein P5055_01360 [Candidatus Paceibacterota bacterium]|nr:hypothetical protein [Candidatus Paceibacterota bacterium]
MSCDFTGCANDAVAAGGNYYESAFWRNVGRPVRLTQDVTLRSGLTLTVEPGVVVECGAYQLRVGYGWTSSGDQAHLRALGVTFRGTGGAVLSEEHRSSSIALTNCVIAGWGTNTTYGVYQASGGDLVMEDCTLTGALIGVYVPAGVAFTASLQNCAVVGNRDYGIRNDNANYVSARSCWWGAPSGPYQPSNPFGTGDAIRGNVFFDPWLTSSPVTPILHASPFKARTVTLTNGGTYNLYVVPSSPDLDVGSGQAPIWQYQLSQMAAIYLTPTNSTNIISKEQAVGSGLAGALSSFVLRSSPVTCQFAYRDWNKDGDLFFAEPIYGVRAGALSGSFAIFDRTKRKQLYYENMLAGVGLHHLPLDHTFYEVVINAESNVRVVAERLNEGDMTDLTAAIQSLLKAYKPEIENLGVPVTIAEGVSDLGSFDATDDYEIFSKLAVLANNPAPGSHKVFDYAVILAMFKAKHHEIGNAMAIIGRFGPFALYLAADIEDVHEQAALEMELRSYLNTTQEARDRVVLYRSAFNYMVSVNSNFDPALGDAIDQLESDTANQLARCDAYINTFKDTHGWLDVPELVIQLNGASGGQIYSAIEKLGERLISAFNKNAGNWFSNSFSGIASARTQAALGAAVTFVSRLKEKTDYHREYASVQTIYEMIRQFSLREAGGRLHTSPALKADYYSQFKTAELLRQYHAYMLIQHYLEYYAAPGLFDWGQMGVDLAIGILKAPGTAGFSAVGSVSAAGDNIATIIYGAIHSDDFRDLNKLGTNLLHNMTADVDYMITCPKDLEALYLSHTQQSISVYDYMAASTFVIIPIPSQTVVVGETVAIPVQVSGLFRGDTATVKFSGAVNGSGTTICFTPTAGNVGLTNIHVSATSGWSGSANFTLNLTVLAIAPPTNLPPNVPNNVSPTNWVANMSLTPKLTATSFIDPDAGDTHAASSWIIRRASDNLKVFESLTDTVNKVELQVPVGVLNHGTEYVWQVRYQDQQGEWSSFSHATRFTTAVATPLTATPLFDGNFGLRVGGLTGEGILFIYRSTNLASWLMVFTNPPSTGSLEWYDRENTNMPAAFYAPLQMIGTGAPPTSPSP